jgi:hypothetical protein
VSAHTRRRACRARASSGSPHFISASPHPVQARQRDRRTRVASRAMPTTSRRTPPDRSTPNHRCRRAPRVAHVSPAPRSSRSFLPFIARTQRAESWGVAGGAAPTVQPSGQHSAGRPHVAHSARFTRSSR